MAKIARIRPPFAWLGAYASAVSLTLVVAIGAFFRFYQLDSLPPGLYQGSAAIGLQALEFLNHGRLPLMNATNAYAPVWVWLQAFSIKLFGHTALALHLWPALLGTLAVLTTWLWARSWFGLRIAWISSFLVAVTPWAVTISRGDPAAASLPLLVTLTLWLATLAHRRQNLWSYLGLGATLTFDLLSGPIGWLLAAVVSVYALIILLREKQLFKLTRARAAGAFTLVLGLCVMAYSAGVSLGAIKAMPTATGLAGNIGTLGNNLIRTILMFNLHGDENYRHNLAGEPMLNAFVGLMLIAGLLVVISRLHQRRYQALLIFTIALILPAVLTATGTPNAARAIGLLPLVLVMAAVGISYMLELWYSTFPINSAARTTGQSAIILLLGLTLFQGYTQYFRAWAGSAEVYAAHNEGAAGIAHNLEIDKFSGDRFLVAPNDEQPVVAYLTYGGKTPYAAIQARDIAGLPVASSNRQFLITASQRDEAVKILKVKFPGGVLRPHYSSFNQAEIYYSYEVSK